ncbi:hypothetical protein L211DRAFT_845943 [Terfezia boudieri ATCC MYA-4762]|uniref:Uncharacterized protein n=1 Tax=Terfezia boudieri ATCC MYA-4762 TaxID=1051890 RepID=A0A3N4M536_9PEZI|nr:hypothetical protein L211DRAFT_845943 [Terfezia boudieri ATCC MYA-4762]
MSTNKQKVVLSDLLCVYPIAESLNSYCHLPDIVALMCCSKAIAQAIRSTLVSHTDYQAGSFRLRDRYCTFAPEMYITPFRGCWSCGIIICECSIPIQQHAIGYAPSVWIVMAVGTCGSVRACVAFMNSTNSIGKSRGLATSPCTSPISADGYANAATQKAMNGFASQGRPGWRAYTLSSLEQVMPVSNAANSIARIRRRHGFAGHAVVSALKLPEVLQAQ